uniref:Protein CUSTOS n=1 Tax=Acanthochromis polyacanthus TaxID=80966 RepID=A0A3Q1FRU0_9TELE
MVGVSDSSSSDDEQLRRCQEAVWETKTTKNKGEGILLLSNSVVVADHEHDGNELQVTKGFQTHVAKKLGHFLDSCISEMRPEASSCVESSTCHGVDDIDEGFRLFSTSVPGQKADDPPAPVRRRPVPSSSDSDSEMEARLKEAAVSVKDLLPSSTQPSSTSPPFTENPCSEKIKKKKKKTVAEEEESHTVKKKKKRKQSEEESEQVDSNAQSNGEHENSEQEHTQVKVKGKKKKKREGNTEEKAMN